MLRKVSRAIAHTFSIQSEKGVTSVEYGLIGALVAVIIIAGISLLGTNLNSIFNYIAGQVVTP